MPKLAAFIGCGLRPGGRLRPASRLLIAGSVAAIVFAPADAANPIAENAANAAARRLATAPDSKLESLTWGAVALLEHGGGFPHPLAVEAVKACHEAIRKEEKSTVRSLDAFDLSGSIVLLSYHDPVENRDDVADLVRWLVSSQLSNGGWGRQGSDGDTLQTAMAAFALWYAAKRGPEASLDLDAVERMADWLIRTQDPRGGWSRYPTPTTGYPIKLKNQTDMTPQRTAMAVAALYLAGDLLHWTSLTGAPEPAVPSVLKPVRGAETSKPRSRQLDAASFRSATRRGAAWLNKQFKADMPDEAVEFFFAWEIYSSIREGSAGPPAAEPKWYAEIAKSLKKQQRPDGSWDASQGRRSGMMTALAYLTLRRFGRSCLDEVRQVGEATLEPATAAAEPQPPRFSALPTTSLAEKLLSMEGPARADALRELLDTARFGDHAQRVQALRVLGKLDDLDQAETLLDGLADPDWRVVRAADEALADLAKSLSASTLPAEPSETARAAAVARWRAWRRAIRPDLEL